MTDLDARLLSRLVSSIITSTTTTWEIAVNGTTAMCDEIRCSGTIHGA